MILYVIRDTVRMRETTCTEFRHHAKRDLNAVQRGERVRIYRNTRPIAELVPVSTRLPAWKNLPGVRLEVEDLTG